MTDFLPCFMKTKTDASASPELSVSPTWLKVVHERVAGLRFGTVQIVIHEGRVTQVDSTERTRIPAEESVAA